MADSTSVARTPWTCSGSDAQEATCSTGWCVGPSSPNRWSRGVDHHLTLFHQRRHTHRVTRIFNEHQEGGGVRQETAVQNDTVGNRGHTEFTHAVVDVVTGSVFVVGLNQTTGSVAMAPSQQSRRGIPAAMGRTLQWRSATLLRLAIFAGLACSRDEFVRFRVESQTAYRLSYGG